MKRIEGFVRKFRMHPNLVDHLSAFIAVVETGSFSAAARLLNRAVSSISYSLTQLEGQCGFPLLDRGSKSSELTERGRALFAEAKAVVERATRFTTHAGSLKKGQETRIRIAVDVLFPSAALYQALKVFAQSHERVRVQLFTSSLNSLWDDLRSGAVDFSFALLPAIPLDMEGRSYHKISLGPVASTRHPLARLPQPLQMVDFQRERQIYYVGSHSVDLERSGRVFSSDVWTSNDLEHISHMIRNGLGWCFATDDFFQRDIKEGLITKLHTLDAQLNPTRATGAVWPIDRVPGPLGHELIELVAVAIGEAPLN